MNGMDESPEEGALYRFKVRTAAGREGISRVVAVPVRAGVEQREAARQVTDGRLKSLKDEQQKKLANPRWSAESFTHGDQVTLSVDAPEMEGNTIRFEVEVSDGADQWKPFTTLTANVQGGAAS